ncbi:MAG: hypothetical protein WC291_11395 [Thermodesulfovibrionales bacterium]|jgi:hypothetical protein
MNCTRLDEEFPFTAAIKRSPGVHLMDVIKDMARELFNAGLKYVDGVPDPVMFEKGFIWERLLSRAFGDDKVTRPGEIMCDGIACSPDGIEVDEAGEIVVWEYKCTTMGTKHSPEDTWSWKMQALGYCHVVGANTAIFRILHLLRDWKEERHVYAVWRLEFTDAEIEDTWMSIVNHAKMRGWV